MDRKQNGRAFIVLFCKPYVTLCKRCTRATRPFAHAGADIRPDRFGRAGVVDAADDNDRQLGIDHKKTLLTFIDKVNN